MIASKNNLVHPAGQLRTSKAPQWAATCRPPQCDPVGAEDLSVLWSDTGDPLPKPQTAPSFLGGYGNSQGLHKKASLMMQPHLLKTIIMFSFSYSYGSYGSKGPTKTPSIPRSWSPSALASSMFTEAELGDLAETPNGGSVLIIAFPWFYWSSNIGPRVSRDIVSAVQFGLFPHFLGRNEKLMCRSKQPRRFDFPPAPSIESPSSWDAPGQHFSHRVSTC